MKTEITTSRLRLVPCAVDNFDDAYRLWTNEEVRRFLFDDRAITEEEARGFIAASDESFAREGFGLWLIRRKELPAAPIGFAGLLAQEAAAPHLIYGLHPLYRGAGFAAEAARGVLSDAFLRLNLAVVAADVDEPNVDSVRVLERLGMRRTGRATVAGRPLLYFAATREEFLETV